ncbi:15485_t:CDS:2, partial [Dentiscutata heterogama]
MPDSIERNRHRRVIRRAPLWERITSWPGNKLAELQEDWALNDWDSIYKKLSWPASLFLNGLSISLRLGYWFDSSKYDPVFNPRMTTFALWLAFFEWTLLVLSIANAIFVYMSFKEYQMFEHDFDSRPNSPNAYLKEIGDTNYWTSSFPGNIIYGLYSWIFDDAISNEERHYVWVIRTWDPPIFFLNIFCYYSPAQVLILQYLDADNYQHILLAAAFVGFNLKLVVKAYEELIKDKQLIAGEIMNEYNKKLVYPHLFVRKFEI